jgi:dTDP-4-dehydrorhamnose 3,5-epimerase-like enzyme
VSPIDRPTLLQGDLATDDRGSVGFVNDFDLQGTRRFYVVRNHRAGFVRAWHGHRQESKAVTVLTGTALVCCVQPDDWENPSPDLHIDRFVLASSKPSVLVIPSGYANGSMSLTSDATLLFFSDSALEESHGDDYRFPSRLWDPWQVQER